MEMAEGWKRNRLDIEPHPSAAILLQRSRSKRRPTKISRNCCPRFRATGYERRKIVPSRCLPPRRLAIFFPIRLSRQDRWPKMFIIRRFRRQDFHGDITGNGLSMGINIDANSVTRYFTGTLDISLRSKKRSVAIMFERKVVDYRRAECYQ